MYAKQPTMVRRVTLGIDDFAMSRWPPLWFVLFNVSMVWYNCVPFYWLIVPRPFPDRFGLLYEKCALNISNRTIVCNISRNLGGIGRPWNRFFFPTRKRIITIRIRLDTPSCWANEHVCCENRRNFPQITIFFQYIRNWRRLDKRALNQSDYSHSHRKRGVDCWAECVRNVKIFNLSETSAAKRPHCCPESHFHYFPTL